MYCAVDDSLQYGLEVVRRTGDGAQHFRDGRPLPKNLGQLLLQIRTAVSSFGRFAGFGLIHRCSFPIYDAARDGIAPAAPRIAQRPAGDGRNW